jgi:DNA-binding transcriptional MerR regulator
MEANVNDSPLDFLTTKAAAEILGMSADRVRQLEREGILPCLKSQNGVRMFLRGDVLALDRKRRGVEVAGA